jgi:hypothetical protein
MATKAFKAPCEVIVWDILPVIRKELAKTLIEKHGFTQRKAAAQLGLTEATVSRYISGKRGQTDLLKNLNGKFTKTLNAAAENIVKGDTQTVILETCRLCHLLQDAGALGHVAE